MYDHCACRRLRSVPMSKSRHSIPKATSPDSALWRQSEPLLRKAKTDYRARTRAEATVQSHRVGRLRCPPQSPYRQSNMRLATEACCTLPAPCRLRPAPGPQKRIGPRRVLLHGKLANGEYFTSPKNGSSQLSDCERLIPKLTSESPKPTSAPDMTKVGPLVESTAKAKLAGKNIPAAFWEFDWFQHGIFFGGFKSRAKVGAALLKLDANLEKNAVSFQAWLSHQKRSINIGPNRKAQIQACCNGRECGDFLVTSVTPMTQFSYEYSSLSGQASGSHTLYSVSADVDSVRGSSKLSKWYQLELTEVPSGPRRKMEDICGLSSYITAEKDTPKDVKFYCPLPNINFSGPSGGNWIKPLKYDPSTSTYSGRLKMTADVGA